MSEQTDDFQDLMKRVREGSSEAIAHLLEEYGQHVLRIVRRRLSTRMRSKYDSRDFTQDIWMNFFAREIQDRHFESPEALQGFLARVAKNTITDAYRKRMEYEPFNIQREKSLDGSAAAEAVGLSDDGPSPSQVAIANEKWDQIKNQVDLPARRILEMLREGLSHVEIARRLGVNEKTVRRVVSRASAKRPREDDDPELNGAVHCR
jgi:RNA polymerase sigma-70 factor (ECF subfamily)